jgi:alpha-methylacyl-CoA racemase
MKILDLSHRLPGPLAGLVLGDLGHEVIKIEDEDLKDPFLDGFFSSFDPSFSDWYHELNRSKKIIRLPLSTPEGVRELFKFIKNADGLILSQSEKLKMKWGLTAENLSSYPLSVVELGSSEKIKTPMHDLNALAHSGLLKLFLADQTRDILSPPFLPFAGITFGQQVATTLLSMMLKTREEKKLSWKTVYLLETIEKIYRPLWSLQSEHKGKVKFLHNGAYPCYCLYKLKGPAYLAVAAVEEKFWVAFSEAFKIKLEAPERFNTDPDSFKEVSRAVQNVTLEEAKLILKDNQWCISLIEQ